VAALPTAHEFHVPLGSDERAAVAGELQRMLVSDDLLIRIAGSLEKHLWMIRAQRDRA
jgi:hypothetical protein